jgi:hypothetical protein
MSWNGRRRRKLDDLAVQLKGRTEIDRRALRWLHDHGPFTVREIGRGVHIAGAIHVDGCAAFRVKDLLQSLLRAGLLRWFFSTGE